MGRSAKRKDDKGGEKKRKRRKKARTDVSSDSDSSSSSSSSEGEVKAKKTSAKEDVEMDDAPVTPSVLVPAILEDGESDDEDAGAEPADTERPNEKDDQIPMELRDFHDSQAEAKFEEYYMRFITEEFGDDLNNLRNAKDFGDKSLPLLVKALRQGINIFSAEEKRTIVKESA